MFNLGLWEIFILAAVALIVVGPEKLPKLARDVARFLNEVKRTTGSITQEMNKALDEDDFQQSKIKDQPPQDPLAELRNSAEVQDDSTSEHDPVESVIDNNTENTTEEKTDV